MSRRSEYFDACAEVKAWNDAHPVGTPVRYWTGERRGEGRMSKTRSAAQLVCDHGSVWVEGEASCIALSHVEPLPAAQPEGAARAVHIPVGASLEQFAFELTSAGFTGNEAVVVLRAEDWEEREQAWTSLKRVLERLFTDWDLDHDMRVGKTLRCLLDPSANYSEDVSRVAAVLALFNADQAGGKGGAS